MEEVELAGGGVKKLLRRVARPLSSLKLAIAELAVIAALCAVGTWVEQVGDTRQRHSAPITTFSPWSSSPARALYKNRRRRSPSGSGSRQTCAVPMPAMSKPRSNEAAQMHSRSGCAETRCLL